MQGIRFVLHAFVFLLLSTFALCHPTACFDRNVPAQ